MLSALTATAAVAASAIAGLADAQPVVHTPDGPVVGFTVDGVDGFRGIPFAAPPVGDLRLRPPRPPMPWTQPLDATQWAPSCLQRGCASTGSTSPGWPTLNVTVGSEDCLYANVYAPSRNATAAAGPLPVMV
jgi:para-nitrobenzyl esterase